MSSKAKNIMLDVRFWILFFILLRMTGIVEPPLDPGHSWRQTTVAMVARNFLEVDANIFYPRVDFAGEHSGITGMEFPLLNYLIFLFSAAVGYQHWYGRLIVLIISSFGVYSYHRILRRFFSDPVALFSSLILLASLWFSYGRKIMPDVFAASLMLIGIDALVQWMQGKKWWNYKWLMGVVFLAMGLLSKLPVIILMGPIPVFFIASGGSFSWKDRHFRLLVVSAPIIIVPSLFWYYYWVPHLVETYHFWHFFMGKSFSEGFREVVEWWPNVIDNFYNTALKYIGAFVCLAGIVLSILQRKRGMLLGASLVLLLFCGVILKSGHTFAFHDYYMIPFIPVMTLFAGVALAEIPRKRIAWVVCVAIMLEGVLNQWHDLHIREGVANYEKLEAEIDPYIGRDDRIFVNAGMNPTAIYFTHRKGWIGANEEIENKSFRDSLRQLSLDYIVILKHDFGTDLDLDLPMVAQTVDWKIYRLSD